MEADMDDVVMVCAVLSGRTGGKLSTVMDVFTTEEGARERCGAMASGLREVLDRYIMDEDGTPSGMTVQDFLVTLGIGGIDFVSAKMPVSGKIKVADVRALRAVE